MEEGSDGVERGDVLPADGRALRRCVTPNWGESTAISLWKLRLENARWTLKIVTLFYHHLHFVTMRFQSLILLVFVLSLGVLADAKRLTADECKGETECGC